MSVRLNKSSAHNKTKVACSHQVQIITQNKTYARNKTKALYCHKMQAKINNVHCAHNKRSALNMNSAQMNKCAHIKKFKHSKNTIAMFNANRFKQSFKPKHKCER